MTDNKSLTRKSKFSRLAALAAAIGMVAALSGCVVYPVGYGAPPHYYHYWR